MTELVIIDDRVFTCDDNWDVTQKNTSQLLCVIQKTFDIAECTYTQIDSIAKSILEQPLPTLPLLHPFPLRHKNLPAILFKITIKASFIINILKFEIRILHTCIFFMTTKAKAGFLIATCFPFGLKYIKESNFMRFKIELLNTRFFASALACLKKCWKPQL